MPELIYDAQDQVPEALKSIAVEKDGKFVANVVPKAELDDFRNRNIAVAQERDGLKSIVGRLTTDLSFDPEDPDTFVTEIGELRTIKQQVDDGKLVKDTSLEEAVQARTGEMKRGFDAKVNGLETENKNLKSENEKLKTNLNRTRIDHAVMEAISDPKSGALPEATRPILREAYETFSIDPESDKIVAKDSDGNVIYGGDGATVMTPAEWLKKLQETQPFFFKSAQGGGAGGGGPTGGALTQAQLDAMSPEEKMNYGREHGLNRS